MRFEYSAGAVVYKGSGTRRKYLFLQVEGKNRYYQGMMRFDRRLDLPKGHIEKGERAREAAVREVKEESGLDIELDPYFRHDIEYWFAEKGAKIKKHVTMLLAKVGEGQKVKLSYEHTSYVWLDYDTAMRKLQFKQWKETVTKADEYINRKEQMEKLNGEYKGLPARMRGWSLSKKLVPGEGPLDAKVMLIGQAPGASEDEKGRPFVGISGRLLDNLLRKASLRKEKCYITSVVQFFPPKNRVPTRKEIALCKNFLLRQIEIVKPRIIVLLGSVAAKNVIEVNNIMQRHGTFIRRGTYTYFLTLHPAAAVRLKKNMPIIENDFRKLKLIL